MWYIKYCSNRLNCYNVKLDKKLPFKAVKNTYDVKFTALAYTFKAGS